MKLLWLLALAAVACKFVAKRWPWEFISPPGGRSQSRDMAKDLIKARNLLGVNRVANRIEIIEAHKRLVATVHPDRGGTNEQVHEANAARDLLLAELASRIPE